MKNIYRSKDAIIFKNGFQDFETGRLLSPVETAHYTVIQVADSYYGARFAISPHKQYCDLEVTLPLSGGLLCATHGVWKRLSKHEAYFNFAGDVHALQSARGCRFQTLAINVKDDVSREMLAAVKVRYGSAHSVQQQFLATLFSALVAEFVPDAPSFFLSCVDSLITAILVKLARGEDGSKPANLPSAQDVLPAVVNYLDLHFLEMYSLEELSNEFGYDYNYICKIFKKRYGLTPSEYLHAKKMEHAALLLGQGLRVQAVAERLGYATPYNFSRAFKRYCGIPPMKYQAEHK